MLEIVKKHPGAIAAALIFHLLIGLLFVVGFNWTEKPEIAGNPVPVKIVSSETALPSSLNVDLPELQNKLQKHSAEIKRIQQQRLEIERKEELVKQPVKQTSIVVPALESQVSQQLKIRNAEEVNATKEKKAKEEKQQAETLAEKIAKEKAKKQAREKAIKAAKAKERARKVAKAKERARKVAKAEAKKKIAREKAEKERVEKEALAKAKAEKVAQEAKEREQKNKAKKLAEAKAREAEEKKRQQGIAALAAAAKAKRDEEKQAQKAADEKRQAALAAKAAADKKAQQAKAAQQAKERAIALGNWKSKVGRHVRPRWQTPPGSGGMKATVKVKISRSGYIRSLSLLNCSGSVSFCESIEIAFKNSEPLPSPSRNDLFQENLVIGFKR